MENKGTKFNKKKESENSLRLSAGGISITSSGKVLSILLLTITLIGVVLALFQLANNAHTDLKGDEHVAEIHQLLDSMKLQDKNIEYLKLNFGILNKLDTAKLDKGTVSELKLLSVKLNKIEASQLVMAEKLEGFRQAFNPTKPDEVLTIIRLKDEISSVDKNVSSLKEEVKEKQTAFEESLQHQLEIYNILIAAILAALIPLVFSFTYKVWKEPKTANAIIPQDDL